MNVVDAVDVVRKPRPKKNRKRWCKGKEGVSHQFVQVARSRCITFERGIYLYTTYPTTYRCANCGKMNYNHDREERVVEDPAPVPLGWSA